MVCTFPLTVSENDKCQVLWDVSNQCDHITGDDPILLWLIKGRKNGLYETSLIRGITGYMKKEQEKIEKYPKRFLGGGALEKWSEKGHSK